MLEYNFKKADRILSTSHIMAKEISLYTNKEIDITPFGIDFEHFKPEMNRFVFNETDIVIGTIKTLEKIYRIDKLIKVFSQLKKKHKDLPLKLLIVGGGSLELELKKQVYELGLVKDTIFTGYIPYNEVQNYHQLLDIFVALSERESFGVSILEAQSLGERL